MFLSFLNDVINDKGAAILGFTRSREDTVLLFNFSLVLYVHKEGDENDNDEGKTEDEAYGETKVPVVPLWVGCGADLGLSLL